jgi:hypothetical protein
VLPKKLAKGTECAKSKRRKELKVCEAEHGKENPGLGEPEQLALNVHVAEGLGKDLGFYS